LTARRVERGAASGSSRSRPDREKGIGTPSTGIDATAQARLVRSWPGRIRVVETHISYVLLAGRYAYKIKKPVNFGFLDFSSLEKRRQYCDEEIRLNGRLAPEIYLGVVSIAGTPDAPDPGGCGEPIEYAVKMRRFAQSFLLDRRLANGEVAAETIDALADRIAAFHDAAARCPAGAPFGSPAVVWGAMAENFRQLTQYLPEADAGALPGVETWSRAGADRLNALVAARKDDGMVRECHGDLHVGNIALFRGRPMIFDCIEFNPNLRWIDVINEVAFMVMDLEERGRADYGWRFLSRWLERSGDFAGLPLLAFYQVYRALVRAKVAAIRAGQEAGAERRRELTACAQYLDHAARTMQPRKRFLALMHGVSGAGKSWVSQILLEATGAVRLRSDVERKRLAGLPALAESGSKVDGGIYSAEMTEATYARLAESARGALAAGYPVVVDAASLKAWQRELFRRVAAELDVPFLLVDCRASAAILRHRLATREASAADASEADAAVLERQVCSLDPLTETEREGCVSIETGDVTRDDLLRRFAASGIS